MYGSLVRPGCRSSILPSKWLIFYNSPINPPLGLSKRYETAMNGILANVQNQNHGDHLASIAPESLGYGCIVLFTAPIKHLRILSLYL